MAVSYAAVKRMFRETSGGVANPSVALATIIWQEFTLPVDQENEHSQWTYEYATSFAIGPMAGALLAAILYNIMSHHA
jgi:glycerol uptake facilitator-like aquaporin